MSVSLLCPFPRISMTSVSFIPRRLKISRRWVNKSVIVEERQRESRDSSNGLRSGPMRFEEHDSSTPGSKDLRAPADASVTGPNHLPNHSLNNLNRMSKNEDVHFRPVATVDVLDVDVEGVRLPEGIGNDEPV